MNWQHHAIIHKLCGCAMILAVSACVHPSRVQMDYIAKRDECREMAEQNQQFYAGSGPRASSAALAAKDQNAILAKIFSDCMYVNGWTVATPPTEQQPGDPQSRPNPQQPPQYAGQPQGQNPNDLEWLSTPSVSTQTSARRVPDGSNRYVPASPPLPARDRKPFNAPRQ